MKKRLISFTVLLWSVSWIFAEGKDLFDTSVPIELEISLSLQRLKETKSDTIFSETRVRFQNADGTWDSLPVQIRARGNSRRSICYFPPLRLKFKKKDAKGTFFEGNENLKLVIPCQESANYQSFVDKEFIAYKFYEHLSPYHFKTRKVRLTLTDERGRKDRVYKLTAFLLEDPDAVAKRFGGKISQSKIVLPHLLSDTTALVQDFFAFMIANTDWSNTSQHNAKVMELKGGKYIPLPYDFDMAGLVNAPYAKPYDYLPISSVQQRLYQGICRDLPLTQYVKQMFMTKETDLKAVLNSYKEDFTAADFRDMNQFLNGFFELLRDDRRFHTEILEKCVPMPKGRMRKEG